MGLMVKAACQVGGDRIIDLSPTSASLATGVAVEIETNPFVIGALPEEPSLCDIASLPRDLVIG